MKVIINCDDFGFNKDINERIAELIALNRVTSATLIANAPALEDAIRRLPTEANCSLGVHLNLTEFRPLTPQREIGTLATCLNDEGCFSGEERLRAIRISSGLREAIFRELCLQ